MENKEEGQEVHMLVMPYFGTKIPPSNEDEQPPLDQFEEEAEWDLDGLIV